MVEITQVSDAVHVVNGEAVNWVIASDDSGVTLFDSGYPGDRDDVLKSIAALGHKSQDVRAVVLTHGHIDHMGTAIWWAAEHGVPVYAHNAELGNVRRDYVDQAEPFKVVLNLWRPGWLPWVIHAMRLGAGVRDGIPTAAPLGPELADLPGAPEPIPTPGHSGGHCSFLVAGHVLVVGDAIITGHPVAKRSGPQLLPTPFTKDMEQARRSAEALADVDADVLAPGHGPAWIGSLRDAVQIALSK
ncbi:beta-lactamase-like protein [Mycobacteroides abscessus 5S-0422]|uniref:Metallo-beta-lactamase superfamily protein n=1 Tax=Mycobacteroides abscessus subsp. bolletii 1513 TaxID=1299321 RepID=X8DIV7_9MYCO|nr:MBL fold metallo-hydrolase [Mycobacteroides abscessus]EUA67991.1 metallo-beta-lactamase superfamily protein [Mycobacteroides abscessus subsp. bolletii 1513]ANO00872.1 MBL fold metallo-hydrolase [Mycobacteroides abscessus]EIU04083.1 beta-lactamase-like protein [Mycobacteroides abscessus 5S-0422]EIU08146.1 beta-lactamase-like protein [Mycobacteroides abscessus 5S-0421]EIU11758.1 beta-lactamase-like protein [Mycobacteroides abscessus 5S-0304]